MTDAKRMKNPKATFWTNADLKQTIKQCEEADLTIKMEAESYTVYNPVNNDVVLMGLSQGKNWIVRIDSSYFD